MAQADKHYSVVEFNFTLQRYNVTMPENLHDRGKLFGGPDVWLWAVTRKDAVMIEANCIFEVLDSGLCGYARTSPTAWSVPGIVQLRMGERSRVDGPRYSQWAKGAT
ncbi:hypothetical protein DFH06DRAFT_1139280 [Mycena polygramma]|nr:hypothetical protein DFH06DRAFT_1139280 [Mycena polygramma]